MQQFVKYELLGYRRGQRLRPWDAEAHEMHIGFSAEEAQRIFGSRHPLFKNRFPLADMGWTRREAYGYTLTVWGLATRASACVFCPFHRNCFYQRLKEEDPEGYAQVLAMDSVLETRQADTMIRSPVFMSSSCKRIRDLTPQDCDDTRYFIYGGTRVWDGF